MSGKSRPANPDPAWRIANQAIPTPQHWVWHGRIPLGKLTLLVGDPGVGKSLLVAEIAARVSRGRPLHGSPPRPEINLDELPDDGIIPGQPIGGGVVMACSEDSLDDTLNPRLVAAGAELPAIAVLEGVAGPDIERLRKRRSADPFSPAARDGCHAHGSSRGHGPPTNDPLDYGRPQPARFDRQPYSLAEYFELLEETIRCMKHVRLVILDTLPALLATRSDWDQRDIEQITRFLGSDAYSDGFGRQLLTTQRLRARSVNSLAASLVKLADSRCAAIIGVTHLSRDRRLPLLSRTRCPLSFLAAARSVLLLSVDPLNPEVRILSSLKSTYGPPPRPLTFTIDPTGPRLAWNPVPTENDGWHGQAAVCLPVPSRDQYKNGCPAPGSPRVDDKNGCPAHCNSHGHDENGCHAHGCSRGHGGQADVCSSPDDSPAGAGAAGPSAAGAGTAGARIPSRTPSPGIPSCPLDERRAAVIDAANFLLAALAAGPRPSRDILREAASAAINVATLRRAKLLLNITATRTPDEWTWSLPT